MMVKMKRVYLWYEWTDVTSLIINTASLLVVYQHLKCVQLNENKIKWMNEKLQKQKALIFLFKVTQDFSGTSKDQQYWLQFNLSNPIRIPLWVKIYFDFALTTSVFVVSLLHWSTILYYIDVTLISVNIRLPTLIFK